jgi:DNA-binding IscR family transcriptional regulator
LGLVIVEHLVARGLLIATSEPQPGLVPARDPEQIKLSDFSEALAEVALAQPDLGEGSTLGKLVQAQQQFLAKHNLKEILERPEPPAARGLSDIPGSTETSGSPEDNPSPPPQPA